jgi:hypothetical protein
VPGMEHVPPAVNVHDPRTGRGVLVACKGGHSAKDVVGPNSPNLAMC